MADFIDEDGDGLDDRNGATEAELRAWEAAQGNQGSFDEEYFEDGDSDGFDDSTGLRQSEFAGRYRTQHEWVDVDRDGKHDTSGMSESEHASEPARLGRSRADARDRDAAQPAYDEYVANGGRQADIDAGRTPRPNPSDRGGAHNSGGAGGSGGGGIPQWAQDTRGIPIIGGPADALYAEQESRRQEGMWDGLAGVAPTADALAVDYEHEAWIDGPAESALAGATGDAEAMEAERRALAGFEDIYNSGGLTAADRGRLSLGEQEMGRSMRSQRDADMSQLQARGMGGSGAAVQSMLSAQQGGADMLAGREAQMQIAAQDRAMQALSSAGSMSSNMRGQGWEEDATRRGALDDFNWRNTDDRREHQRWNLGRDDKTAESRAGARQQAYDNTERQVAGKTGQYSTDVSRRSNERQRDDENSKDILGALGELF